MFGQGPVDHVRQVAEIERFGNEPGHGKVASVAVHGANHDHGDLPPVLAQMIDQPGPIQPRHHQIGHDQVRRIPVYERQGFDAIRRPPRFVPLVAQKRLEQIADSRIVIDDQNVCHASALCFHLRTGKPAFHQAPYRPITDNQKAYPTCLSAATAHSCRLPGTIVHRLDAAHVRVRVPANHEQGLARIAPRP